MITRTVAPPTTPMNVALRDWFNMTQDHMQAIVDAADSIQSDANSANVSGIHAGLFPDT